MAYTPVLGRRYRQVSDIITSLERKECEGCVFSTGDSNSIMCLEALEPLVMQEEVPFFYEKRSGEVRCERRAESLD